jgi:DNA-binding NtrC family response regulator
MPNTNEKKRSKILLVDDDVAEHGLVRELLNEFHESNIEIDSAFSVEEAIKKLDYRYDLVISDVQMPTKNGFDLLRHVKNNFPEIDVFLITGYPSDSNEVINAMNNGASGYIRKSVGNDKDFVNQIVNAIKFTKLSKHSKGFKPAIQT